MSSTPPATGRLARMAERNPDLARIVRANLAVYARRSDDPQVRDQVRDVLAGRADLSEVLVSPPFTETVDTHLDNLLAGVEQLSPEEKAQAFDRSGEPTSEAELAALRDAATPGDGWAAEDAAAREPWDRLVRPEPRDGDGRTSR